MSYVCKMLHGVPVCVNIQDPQLILNFRFFYLKLGMPIFKKYSYDMEDTLKIFLIYIKFKVK